MSVRVLGIDAIHPGAGAALVVDGALVATAVESHFEDGVSAGIPERALLECCAQGGVRLRDVDWIAVAGKPYVSLERWIETQLASAPFGFAAFRRELGAQRSALYPKERWARSLRRLAGSGAWERRLLFVERHRCYAAVALSAPAPTAVLVVGGGNEWATVSVASASHGRLEMRSELRYPHGPERLLDAAVLFLGLAGPSELGDAAHGAEPEHVQRLRDALLDGKEDGSFRLALDVLGPALSPERQRRRLAARLGVAARTPGTAVTDEQRAWAASWQALLGELFAGIGRHAAAVTGLKHLTILAGAELGTLAREAILTERVFSRVTLAPAAAAPAAAGAARIARLGLASSTPSSMLAATRELA